MDKKFFEENYLKSKKYVNEENVFKSYIKRIIVVVSVFVMGIIYLIQPNEDILIVETNIALIEADEMDFQVMENVFEDVPNTETHQIFETEYVNKNDTKKAETEIKETNESKNTSNGILVNINTASEKELEKINGIGQAIAKNIIEYRTKHGEFVHKEEIKNVKRIGDKLYEKIKDSITID